MSRVVAVVEGRTEQVFVRDVLAPHLAEHGVYLTARLVGKPGRKGGVGEYKRARKDFLALLKQERETPVTSMFDFYGMPESWPGRRNAKGAPQDRKAQIVEEAIREDVAGVVGGRFDARRFLPYVQLHEYEALLFSQPSALSQVTRAPDFENRLQTMRDEFRTPEEIDDDLESAPSKRIKKLFPYYNKTLHGILAAKRTTIGTMRSQCPHFDEWVTALNRLASPEK